MMIGFQTMGVRLPQFRVELNISTTALATSRPSVTTSTDTIWWAGCDEPRIRITYAYQNHRWIFQRLEFWLDQWIDVTDKKGILTPLVEAASQASDGAERARNTGSYKETGDLRTHRLRTKGA
jgi:hypothetical protein